MANGYDFGDLAGIDLAPLTVAEETLIARNVQYVHVLKLVGGQRALTGHLVAMEHDGRNVVARSLPRLSLDGFFKVVIIGSRTRYNELISSGPQLEQLLGRYRSVLNVHGKKVAKWIAFLKSVNPLYSDVHIVNLTEQQCQQFGSTRRTTAAKCRGD